MGYRFWTKEETEFLINNYTNFTCKELFSKIKRPESSILSKLRKLRLHRLTNNNPGDKFGKLTLIKEGVPNKNSQKFWYCLCDCGKKVLVSQGKLRSGHTTTCGCSRRKERGFASYKQRFSVYKRRAKKRKWRFELTFDQFKNLISGPCFYCKKDPAAWNRYLNSDMVTRSSVKSLGLSREVVERATILTNGIDRIDNNSGYTVKNCVPCCFECNKMKMDISLNEFMDRIYRIYKNKEAILRGKV